MPNIRYSHVLSLLFFIGLGLISQRLKASTLTSHVDVLAKKVAAVCQEDGFRSVRIEFEQPKSTKSGGGSIVAGSGAQMLSSVLAEQLKTKHGISVKKFRADIRLVGEIVVDEFGDEGGNGETTGLALDVTVRFIDRTGKPVVSVRSPKLQIDDEETIALILGVPFDDSGSQGGGGRPTRKTSATPLAEGFIRPKQATSSDGIVRAKSGSPFAIQLVTGGRVSNSRLTGATPVPAEQEDGIAFVGLTRDQEFSVKLINDANFEVGVSLTLDGVDSFHFTKRRSLWLIPPRSSITVNGWQLDNRAAKRFTIFPLKQSVAAQLGLTESVGVIQASFSRTWKPGESVPPGEVGSSRSANGVGAGKKITSRVTTVKRNIGRVRSSIPIRYERPL